MKNMKSKMIALAALAGSIAVPAFGDVQIVITGSTAFRSIAQDRVGALFDPSSTNTATFLTVKDSNTRTYSGTMQSVVGDTQPVTIRLSFSGSASGMLAVKNGTLVSTVNPGDTSSANSIAPDLA